MQKEKKILMVFTGGTIASRLHRKALELGSAPFCLLDSVKRKSYTFDILEPISVLSENITPEMYRVLFSSIAKAYSPRKHSAILIAHGTDTLAYTAQLADLFLSKLNTPIILFGSNRPLEDPKSDARSNFKSSMRLVDQVDSGIYVVSRASNHRTYVHYGAWVQSPDLMTNDFSSYKNQYAGKIVRNEYRPNPNVKKPGVFKDANSLLNRLKKMDTLPLAQTVLSISARSSTHFDHYNLAQASFKYVLLGTHHSGTANALSEDNPYSALYLKNLCEREGKKLFLGPFDSRKVLYSTTQMLLDNDITPIKDMPFESAYTILLVCSWLDKDPDRYLKLQR